MAIDNHDAYTATGELSGTIADAVHVPVLIYSKCNYVWSKVKFLQIGLKSYRAVGELVVKASVDNPNVHVTSFHEKEFERDSLPFKKSNLMV